MCHVYTEITIQTLHRYLPYYPFEESIESIKISPKAGAIVITPLSTRGTLLLYGAGTAAVEALGLQGHSQSDRERERERERERGAPPSAAARESGQPPVAHKDLLNLYGEMNERKYVCVCGAPRTDSA